MFKVGDKVLFVDCEGDRLDTFGMGVSLYWARDYLTKGDIYTIKETDGNTYLILANDHNNLSYNYHQFILCDESEETNQFEEWDDEL